MILLDNGCAELNPYPRNYCSAPNLSLSNVLIVIVVESASTPEIDDSESHQLMLRELQQANETIATLLQKLIPTRRAAGQCSSDSFIT